jgi:prepilin-type N-terminal cleavage/methylation domain-containing protein
MMKKNGFSLIELAISLTIIGLIISGGLQLIKSDREKNLKDQAKDQVKKAIKAIDGFALTYVDLPTWDEFATELSPVGASIADLNKSFFYVVDTNLSNDEDICAFNTTNLKVDVWVKDSYDHTIDNVAYVVAAQGANLNMQTGISSDTVKVYDYYSIKDDNSYDYTRNQRYDDVVQWVTLNELQNLVNCASNKLIITTDNTLPKDLDSSSDYLGSSSSAEIFADKGYPFDDGSDSGSDTDYKWCVENAPSWLNNMNCNGSITSQSDCTSASASYAQCTTLTLDGNPSLRGSAGVDSFKVYLRDKTKTISKQFSITIDTDTSSGGGTGGGHSGP